MDVQETALEAMDLLISNAIQRAGYNKTIQAQIISCEDATIGKYRCRYQDSIFQAYVNNSDMTFNNGSYVYILIPNNDLSKQKIILGTTQKLGINYISQAEGEQAYDIIGTSGVTSTGIYYLDTNNKNYIYNIYDYDENVYDNINLDIISLEQYIKQSSSLIISANIKTTIPRDKQLRGHYGIVFKLRFKDNASGNMVFRSYVIDEDNMIDNPYRLIYPTRQYQIFDIDGENFDRIESISIFNSGFPGAQGNITGGKLTEGDIQISNIQTNGAIRLLESELDGVAISFYTPQGTFFTNQSIAESKKTITAQVKVKGKLVSNAQNIPFYWGRQNVGITPSSESYNKYLGRGWKCLNQSNVITPAKTEEIDGQTIVTEEPVVEWVPAGDTYVISFGEASAAENKIKVAIVYEGTVITKEIIISNKAASVPKITIVSSGGTQFYYDIGHPTLTCLVNNEEVIDQDYHYYWGYESNQGVFSNLQETTAANIDYQSKVSQLDALKADIANGIKFAEQERSNLDSLKDAIYNYKFIQRVKYNKVYDAQIKAITTKGIFKCSVYNGNQYLGTATIILTNSLTGQNLYSLVINNGSETFQYDERGKAPISRDLENPQKLQVLSFSLYDNLGELVEFDNIVNSRDCSIKWYFPIVDTLLQYKKINGDGTDEIYNGNSAGTDARQEYIIYENNQNLIYSIAERYDVTKKKNQIKLNVKYKGMNLTAETNFTFVKQGEPGTNGTDYVVRIVPNTKLSNPPQFPMITKAGSKYLLNYSIGDEPPAEETEIRLKGSTADEFQLFVAQLWKSGELVWKGNEIPYENGEPIPVASDSSVLDNRTRPILVRWEVLKNNYGGNPSVSDRSTFEINALDGKMKYNPIINNVEYPSRDAQINTPLANIIKCSLTIQENGQEKTYYGTIPIVTAWVDNENYRVSLKDYTGFRYVTYSSDGVNPQYDSSHPFEFICKEKINNVWTDISLAVGNKAISYTFGSCGNVVETVKFNTTTQQQEVAYRNETDLLQLQDESYYLKDIITKQPLKDNQRYFQPAVKYNGACVNAGVTCIYTQNNQPIGKIFVPIHLLLNRYGLSEINDWDGNKVQINNEGGYILAPQMGAGTKDSNNNFTGVLMGKVKAPEKKQPDVGLLGYADGERTFFVNSKNGSAIFGKRGIGQIIIDPRTSTSENDNGSRALLYSSNFWKNYDDDGLPTSYKSTNVNHPSRANIAIDEPSSDQSVERYGMLIDLTTPQIVYANGNFKLDANGHITAKGGGQIAGWKINDYSLTSKDGTSSHEPSLTLHSGSDGSSLGGRIYSGDHTTLTDTDQGFFLSKDGLSIGDKFKVDKEGIVTVGQGATAYDHTLDDQTLRYSLPYKLVGDGTSSGEYKVTEEKIFSTRQDITFLVEFVDKQSGNDENPLLEAFDVQGYKGLLIFSENGRLKIDAPPYSSDDKRVHFSYQRNPNKILRFAYTYHPTSNTSQATFNFSIDGEIVQSGIVIDVNGGAYTETTQSTPVVLQGGGFEAITKDLLIGCRYLAFYDDYRYWKGDINKVYIYDSLKDINFINRFLNGENIIGNQGISKKHWVINANSINKETYIAYNTSTFLPGNRDSNLRVYFGTDGLSLGNFFSVDSDGSLELKRGNIKLGYDTIANPPQWRFSVDDSGYLEARSGKIAGIEMWTRGNVSELRAGTKYEDELGNVDVNRLQQGFVFQSSGRILGVGRQAVNNQESERLYQWARLLVLMMTTITDAQGNTHQITEEERTALLNQVDRNYQNGYYGQIIYNIWEFSETYGIFRGGTSTWDINSRYRMQEEHFRIQPGNGYSRFMHSDIVGALVVGGKIYGAKGRTYNSISRFQEDTDKTFSLEAYTGDIETKGNITTIGSGNISSAGTIGAVGNITTSNGYISAAKGWNGNLSVSGNLSATGWIGASGQISSTSNFVLKSDSGRFDGKDANGNNIFSLTTHPVNSVGTDTPTILWVKGKFDCDGNISCRDLYCNSIIPSQPIYAVFG